MVPASGESELIRAPNAFKGSTNFHSANGAKLGLVRQVEYAAA